MARRISRITIIGWLLLLSVVVAIVMLWLGKVSLTEFGTFIGLVITTLVSIGFIRHRISKRKEETP